MHWGGETWETGKLGRDAREMSTTPPSFSTASNKTWYIKRLLTASWHQSFRTSVSPLRKACRNNVNISTSDFRNQVSHQPPE